MLVLGVSSSCSSFYSYLGIPSIPLGGHVWPQDELDICSVLTALQSQNSQHCQFLFRLLQEKKVRGGGVKLQSITKKCGSPARKKRNPIFHSFNHKQSFAEKCTKRGRGAQHPFISYGFSPKAKMHRFM